MLFQGAKFSAISEDVLQRNATSLKHYKENYEDANPPIRERVGAFFSKKDSSAFYTADACTKLQMIAPKHILSEEYLQDLLQVNNCL